MPHRRVSAAGLSLLLASIAPSGARQVRADDAEGAYETRVRASRRLDRSSDDPAALVTKIVINSATTPAATDLAQLMNRAPGVQIKDWGPGQRKTLSLRGAESHQVAFYLDGVPLASASLGWVDLSLFDPAQLAEVEIPPLG